MKVGIKPTRMVAVGYGEHRPIADNSTDEGRQKNRRVSIIIPTADTTWDMLSIRMLLTKFNPVLLGKNEFNWNLHHEDMDYRKSKRGGR